MIDSSMSEFGDAAPGFGAQDEPAETTGRYVVTFREDDVDVASTLQSVAGVSGLVSSADFDGAEVDMAQVDSGGGLYVPDLGVAVVAAEPTQAQAMLTSDAARGTVLAVEPERVHRILDPAEYVQGYRDGVTDLSARLTSGRGGAAAGALGAAGAAYSDTPQYTWGLQATGVVSSPQSGGGIRVAVLDTGFATAHPDFAGRNVITNSFVPGETVEDGHGHGTHVIGTACGPRNPSGVRRYGVAYEADILVGKVLSNAGSGTDTGILAGIAWALAQDATVISMSLGANVREVSRAYEQVGRRALARGALIVAAAGNNANRPGGNFGFVGIPANSPTFLAVGAVDSSLEVASFSARSNPVRGGQVDLAGPGVAVFSSWKEPERYRSIRGTSMATPHVSGIAALWAERTARRGLELWATLAAESVRLAAPALDVGGGLVSAPQ